MGKWSEWYKSREWQKIRQQRLRAEPLCRMCREREHVTAASVVDHVVPHKGDWTLFTDYTNTQSLCKFCHDSTKQSEERLGYSKDIGIDGWPTDVRHPFNRRWS